VSCACTQIPFTVVKSGYIWTIGYQERFEKGAPIYAVNNMLTVHTEEEGETLLDTTKQAYNLDYFNRNVIIGKAVSG
jgi:hypothetical protein